MFLCRNDARLYFRAPKRRQSYNQRRESYMILCKEMDKRLIWGALLAMAMSFSCGRNAEKAPDVSDIEVEVKIKRFEKDLFAIDTNAVKTGLAALETSYPEFSEIFFMEILGSKNPQIAPEGHEAYVRGFLTHPSIRALYDSCMLRYDKMPDIERGFEQAFRYFRYYFPQRDVPDVTTFLSEYSIGNFIYGENSLAVGLDFFLGADHPYAVYNPGNTNFSAYLTRTFSREHLVSKTLQPLIEDMLGAPYGNRLLDMMIYNGKKLYILDKLLPETPDSVKLEITGKQVQWLLDNHLEMWAFFLSEKLLYSSDWAQIRKYVEYSPNSPGMPPEAPGRTANWIGLQIVKAYMSQYPETTMEQLLELKDAQELLTKSRYKPKR